MLRSFINYAAVYADIILKIVTIQGLTINEKHSHSLPPENEHGNAMRSRI